jgi:hypothetical protein
MYWKLNQPVLTVRPDDGPIGPKHVALNVLLMVVMDVLVGNINTLYKISHVSYRDLKKDWESLHFSCNMNERNGTAWIGK